jgi:hypothetical protein
MSTVTTTPGDRVDTAGTIPEALAALAAQLTAQLPGGPIAWSITDPTGTEHRGTNALNGRLDQLEFAVDELVDALYDQLHRSADGGPHASRQQERKPYSNSLSAARGHAAVSPDHLASSTLAEHDDVQTAAA